MWYNSMSRILVRLNGILLEAVDCFRYFGMDVAENCRMENDHTHRLRMK